MQIQQALALHTQLAHQSESAALDIELMLCALLDKPRSYLFTWPDKVLPEPVVTQLNRMIQRRLKGEPVAHILGGCGLGLYR